MAAYSEEGVTVEWELINLVLLGLRFNERDYGKFLEAITLFIQKTSTLVSYSFKTLTLFSVY